MGVDDGLKLLGVSEFSNDARFAFWIKEAFELAVEAVGTDTGAEVFGRNFCGSVGFVDYEKIVGKEDAFCVGRESSCV